MTRATQMPLTSSPGYIKQSVRQSQMTCIYHQLTTASPIGYKEFVTHLQLYPLPADSEPESLKSFFEPALAQMKHNTRKYAQRQVKWIRNKLLPSVHASNVQHQSDSESAGGATKCCVYLLDATGMSFNILNTPLLNRLLNPEL